MRILVTGGCGFIGSNFVRLILSERPDWHVTNVDKLTYAGNPANLEDVAGSPNYRFLKADICDKAAMGEVFAGKPDAVVHFAAESHVDRSITGPEIFVITNVLGTQNLLENARAAKTARFLHVSTDEVYGTLGATGLFTETTPYAPNSPYSASKAGSDLLVRSYHHTFGMDTVITNCSNNYGPYQYPEKLIPLLITNLVDGLQIPIYGDGLNVRDWLHVEDHCRGILLALEKGRAGETYNIGGRNERKNIEIARGILKLMGKDESSIRYVEDRLGHDKRYAIDADKIRAELGWEPRHTFDTGLPATVEWYKANEKWWRPLKKK
ncbi:MAG TPA: dTDP-glucose 4,6-dehydratase [Fibrobacteria bacterium]|jgi:dTDP-glucose 4,6-dehydratase|nr:dTDP-glucose 4,6-dehydratase [Fibrobacteria bacterium]